MLTAQTLLSENSKRGRIERNRERSRDVSQEIGRMKKSSFNDLCMVCKLSRKRLM